MSRLRRSSLCHERLTRRYTLLLFPCRQDARAKIEAAYSIRGRRTRFVDNACVAVTLHADVSHAMINGHGRTAR